MVFKDGVSGVRYHGIGGRRRKARVVTYVETAVLPELRVEERAILERPLQPLPVFLIAF